METQHFDSVIVGGGLVGLTLAITLAQKSNYHIALLEAQPTPVLTDIQTDNRALALAYGSQLLLEQLHIWPGIAHAAKTIEHIHVSSQGQWGKTRIHAHTEKLPALGYIVPHALLLKHLYQLLNEHKITLFQPAKIKQIKDTHTTPKLEIEHNNQTKILTTDLLIAADGARSQIRQHCSIEAKHKNYQQHAIVAAIDVQNYPTGWAFERFTAQGPVAVLPGFDQTATLVWATGSAHSAQLMKLPETDFVQRAQQHFGHLAGSFGALKQRINYPLHLVWSTHPYAGKVLLFGNAAHNLHPVAGQGFNLSLRDINCFTQLAKNHGNLAQSATRLIAQFCDKTQQDRQHMVTLTDGLLTAFAHKNPLIQCGRSLALDKLNKIPAAKTALNNRFIGLK